MEDSFNVYDWKQNPNPESEKDNKFNLHEWNKKRYLGELDISDEEEDNNVSATNVSGNVNIDRGGDDPKIGAELEAGVVGDRVAERISDNVEEVSYKLGDLKWENIVYMIPDVEKSYTGVSFPYPSDELLQVKNEKTFENWKEKTMEDYGYVIITVSPKEAWYDVIKIEDKEFQKDKENYMKSKARALDNWRSTSNSGLD